MEMHKGSDMYVRAVCVIWYCFSTENAGMNNIGSESPILGFFLCMAASYFVGTYTKCLKYAEIQCECYGKAGIRLCPCDKGWQYATRYRLSQLFNDTQKYEFVLSSTSAFSIGMIQKAWCKCKSLFLWTSNACFIYVYFRNLSLKWKILRK